PLGPQDAPTGDVPFPGFPQGARPHDLPDRRDALRLDAARPVGGGLPRRWDLEPSPGRGRRDGGPAPPAVREDAVDEPRSQCAGAPPRRREVLRVPRDLEEKVKARQATSPPHELSYRGGSGAAAIRGGVVDAGRRPLLIRFQTR